MKFVVTSDLISINVSVYFCVNLSTITYLKHNSKIENNFDAISDSQAGLVVVWGAVGPPITAPCVGSRLRAFS